VEPSEELHRIVTRFFEALRDGDTEAVSNRLSRLPGFQQDELKGIEGLQRVYPLASEMAEPMAAVD